jgi:bacteriocin-like protein
MYFSDEQERTMRNQETTITILSDSISSQSKTETTNTHIELSEEELDKITGGGGPPTTVRD